MDAAETHRDRVICGLLALREDPGCIEAHLFLAEHVIEDWECYAHLSKAVETGRALWEPVAAREAAADEGFSWWGVFATRPYMRAIAALADWQREHGDVESAAELYQDLLAKNPHDNQGIRYKLAAMPEAVTPGM
ncbi:hypothetical protein [Dankookia sp. P2]|uniref:hypothetical protein n=1 Tax=Dankookia sp. P2 TaxID=3423955 RepID=UPI003D665606